MAHFPCAHCGTPDTADNEGTAYCSECGGTLCAGCHAGVSGHSCHHTRGLPTNKVNLKRAGHQTPPPKMARPTTAAGSVRSRYSVPGKMPEDEKCHDFADIHFPDLFPDDLK